MEGRANIFKKLRSQIKPEDQLVWFHCASLGEFEQGRPLIEKYKAQGAGYKVLLTFFSPSGYEVRKNYQGADYVFYLPLDTPANAKEFIEIIKPKAAFFIKYEFWYNYLAELKKQNVPSYLISGIFRPEQYFFKWYNGWFRKQLNNFTCFFLQNEQSQKLLESIGYKNSIVSGDTRFDRVCDLAENAVSIPAVEKFKNEKHLVIAGSTWNEDEKLLVKLIPNSQLPIPNFKLIIAPHEIDEAHLQSTIKLFGNLKVVRFSQANESVISAYDVLIIDNIGMLSSIYKYADVAYIGGGFGNGIHNVLEAAVFGIPVIFGPNYQKSDEAKDLIKLKGAFPISSSSGLKEIISKMFFNAVERMQSGMTCKDYVSSGKGAVKKILDHIDKKSPFLP